MAVELPERDWKYMQKIRNDLLESLCRRINNQSLAILSSDDESEHEKYIKNYKHIQTSNRIVADSFDDWRRSKLIVRLIALRHQDLLTDEHIEHLSEETRERLQALREQ